MLTKRFSFSPIATIANKISLENVWKYTPNRAVLHSDPSLMPKRRGVWSLEFYWRFEHGRREPTMRDLLDGMLSRYQAIVRFSSR